jgi:L-asparaginase / beta-aspartyl-peptidase
VCGAAVTIAASEIGKRVLDATSSAIIVHGGAGEVSADRFDRLREGTRRAAAAGDAILLAGGSALDAAEAAVRMLEDDPEYNAGTGSALTRDGKVETDAAIMDGASQRVGAVAAVPDLTNPIVLARAVLDAGEHAILAGMAVWRFAAERHIRPASPGQLITDRARERLAKALSEKSGGTVGAVARDRNGRFAAATSTGGIVGKRAGRVGDSPIPGAGTWADARCAISATGDGEAILRVALSRTIAMRVASGSALRDAVIESLRELHAITSGSAGVIGVDQYGVIALQLSSTMPIAFVVRGDAITIDDSMGEQIASR